MNLVQNHLTRIVNQDYLIKYSVKTPKLLPKLEKVVLNTQFNNLSKGSVLTILEILGYSKPYLTISKVNDITLNLRKKDLVGAKLVLKKKAGYEFLQTFLYEILPYSQNTRVKYKNSKLLHHQIKDIFVIDSSNAMFDYLRSVKTVDLAITITNITNSRFPLQI